MGVLSGVCFYDYFERTVAIRPNVLSLSTDQVAKNSIKRNKKDCILLQTYRKPSFFCDQVFIAFSFFFFTHFGGNNIQKSIVIIEA